MFYVILMIFHFSFLLVKCDNATSSAVTTTVSTTSVELMAEQIAETVDKMDKKQFSRHARFITLLRSAFASIRLLVKSLITTYSWYSPEFELGKCVLKYMRTLYPNLRITRLSYENMSKYLQSLYFAIYGYITEMINENRQDIQDERQRIGIKVAEMTVHDVISPTTTTTSSSSSWPLNHVESSFSNYNDRNFNYEQKFRTLFPNNNYHEKNHQKPSVRMEQSYENELEMAESFNDFSPRTRRMDIFKFDKNNFLANPINEKEYKANNSSSSLETEVPFDLEKFETQHSNNYNMPTADYSSSSFTPSSSSSSFQSTTSAATNILFDRRKIVENKNFSQALAVLEDNLNVKESHKRDEKENKFSVMYFGPRQFSTDYQDMSPSLDDTPTLELNKNSNSNDGDENDAGDDSNIFDFENIILESFGFNVKAVKSSSLAKCVRSYGKNLFQRTFEYFILM